jgi:hypothetical protein
MKMVTKVPKMNPVTSTLDFLLVCGVAHVSQYVIIIL